jgi:hypothetical protein
LPFKFPKENIGFSFPKRKYLHTYLLLFFSGSIFLVDWKENNSFIAQKKLKASPPKENICYSFPQQKNFYMPIYFFFPGSIKKYSFIHSSSPPPAPPLPNKVKEFPKEIMFFCFTKFFFTYLLFFWRWSLWFLEKKDPFLHSLQHPAPLTYLLFLGGGGGGCWSLWFLGKRDPFIHSLQPKKERKRVKEQKMY